MFKKLLGKKDNKYKFVAPEPTTDTCPYCGVNLNPIPKRKKKCPECGNNIFVRWEMLYTEDEIYVKDWLDHYNAQKLGITKEIFNKTRESLSEEFGFLASVKDSLWRLLNRINSPEKSFDDRRIIYLLMGDILTSQGKNADKVLSQAHEMEILDGQEKNSASAKAFKKDLLEMKESGSNMLVKICTAKDGFVCDECDRLSKMTFTIEEVLETMPIPHKCTNAKCRCWYTFVFPVNV